MAEFGIHDLKGEEKADREAQMLGPGPKEQAPGVRTFYSFFGADTCCRPSNQQIPLGGERRLDAAGKVMYAPFRLIEFHEGIYRTEDPEEIAVLEKLARNPGSGITEDRELYLSKVLPKEKQVEMLARRMADQTAELEKLKADMLAGQAKETPKIVAGPIGTGSVPRRTTPR